MVIYEAVLLGHLAAVELSVRLLVFVRFDSHFRFLLPLLRFFKTLNDFAVSKTICPLELVLS